MSFNNSSGNSLDQSNLEKASCNSEKRLTVSFKDLGIRVHGAGEDYVSTIASVAAELFTFSRNQQHQRYILQGVTGQVRPGETLLVLGRPGSGCTSLLKLIANMRDEFPTIEGSIRYGNIGPNQTRPYRQHIVMNTEDDIHFPTLKVSETMQFAASTKVPASHRQVARTYASSVTDQILKSLGISHTKSTMVGNEFIRGVSGGERKRSSLAEVMATQAVVQCWDNSTRGLDASNALDFAKVLRQAAKEENKTIVATLYQAGNGIYKQFDKVLVLAEGREIYFGPTSEAQKYFEDMGFMCTAGANVADFLTSVAVHTERVIKPGCEGRVSNTAEEFENKYKASDLYQRMLNAMESVDEAALAQEVEDLHSATISEKNRSVEALSRDSSPYMTSLFNQIKSCTIRQFQIMWGDKWSNGLKIASAVIMALVSGSCFYHLSTTSESIELRAGALYWPLLLFCLNAMSETTASFMGRPILLRHRQFGFYRPTAFVFANVAADIPLSIVLFSCFEVVYYFLVHFQQSAEKFFTSWFIYIVATLCFLSFYRMIGAWCKTFGLASQISGWSTMVMMVYTGYLIPRTSMRPWFKWICRINPAYYAFEAAMGNEFGGLQLTCVEPDLVPYGPGYMDGAFRSCTITGTSSGSNIIHGQEYIWKQYTYSEHHVWRNVGIVIGFWIFFALMTAAGFELRQHNDAGAKVLYERSAIKRQNMREQDKESATTASGNQVDQISAGSNTENSDKSSETMFTFKDISYFVHHEGSEKKLLDNISGYATSGQLVALMGSSGAGKTTLMDVLAQRKDMGRIEGSIKVDGRPQDITFQRTTGYCEQNDVHEPSATVRESLLFSARLRQNFETLDEEKVAYVEKIMDLLELQIIQHAVIGSPGCGLSIEQRKRLTLAVELVAKPKLIFLDEPTSGLDGQSAFGIVQFLRKLAKTGQTIICTIHQPSATLFEAFDVLMLLARGGKTAYFGPTGKDSGVLLDYFARNGAPCPTDTNPAEHIVDVVQGRLGIEVNWPNEWLKSPERVNVLSEIDRLNDLKKQERPDESESTHKDYATPIWYQTMLVSRRQLLSLWRNPDYSWNKMGLHVSNSLFGGFTYYRIGRGVGDLQLRVMAVFNFVFVAPGCINQLQPLFIKNRNIFETREKKSKTYHWLAFISAQLISEMPLLIVCGTIYFVAWYFTCGFPVAASHSGAVYLQMLFYELLYTAIGQAIAAYSPNEYFAALANPLLIGIGLIQFCGVLVPYDQMQVFWKYWMYWLDPFTYLIGGLFTPVVWDVNVECKASEHTTIPLPSNTTCGDYMANFLTTHNGYILDPSNTTACEYCEYSYGSEYAKTFNIVHKYDGWRDIALTALFCFSSYALVFAMMKLRSKATKTAA